jgi:hypothetical protein
MFWKSVRRALTAGLLAVGLTGVARAEDPCCAPAPCAPAMKTICVTEYKQEAYETTRTSYKTEWKEEKVKAYKTEWKEEAYTTYKTECVPETKTREVTCYKQVAETQTLTRKVATCVPTVEEKTVYQSFTTCVAVPCTVKKCVDKGHYECHEEICKPSCFSKLFSHKHNSCDCECEPVKTKTVKVWVPCPVIEESTVITYKKVTECKPVTCKVTVNKLVWKEEPYTCTTYKCVPETKTETYTVYTAKSVAVPCTRKVAVCVPYETTCKVAVCVPVVEKVTAYRCVPVTVTKQVPVCETCAYEHAPKHHIGLFSKHKSCDCE